MIRQWLEKPWVSAGLVLVAITVIYLNVWKPARTASIDQGASDPMIDMPIPSSSRPSDHHDAVGSAANWNRLAALAEPSAPKDPFLPPRSVSNTGGNSGPVGSPALTGKRMPNLRLRAIMRGADGEYAWIDDQLVHPGESLHGMRVVHIGDNSVDLRRGGRRMRIFLDSPASQGPRP